MFLHIDNATYLHSSLQTFHCYSALNSYRPNLAYNWVETGITRSLSQETDAIAKELVRVEQYRKNKVLSVFDTRFCSIHPMKDETLGK